MYFRRGLILLSHHHTREAAHFFERALKSCPPTAGKSLYRICFYLGIALRRLGHPETAFKSWVSCQRLEKRGRARKMIVRLANSYGMIKQERESQDDWKAFVSIQLTRYLQTKNKRVFSTMAEQDMVIDLIRDYWRSLLKSGTLARKTCEEKQAIFSRTRIVFPTIMVPEEGDHVLIPVNFKTKARVKAADKCFCGSGLPYNLCCGRTPGCDEVLSGIF